MTPRELRDPFEQPGGLPPPRPTDLNAKADLLDALTRPRADPGREARPGDGATDRPEQQSAPPDDRVSRATRGAADVAVEAKAALLDPPAQPDRGDDGIRVERASHDRWRVPTPPRTLPDGHPLLRETNTINTPERVAFRQGLVARVIGDARPPTDGPPKLDVMGGGGASGKGAVLDYLVLDGRVSTDNAVRLDPDGVKELIPEFGEVVRAGDSRAADVVHEESSQVAKSVLSEAMDRRLNIVYDVTLGNPDKSTRVLQDAKDRGYEVNLWGVTADPEVAVERAASRAEHSGRYVPVDRQLEAHRGFSAGFERYAAIVDKARLFDTNGPEPRLIARARAGEIRVIDEDAYDAFQTKAAIDPEAGGPSELYGRRSAP